MSETTCQVFYVNGFGLPLFAQRLAEHGGIRLTGITAQTDAALVQDVLAQSHVYQVSSGVNDVPTHYLVAAQLLDRAPALLMVSTIGAGYDTVDLAECTRRGIAVMNQSGGANAQAVVEHTLAMMLALGKRMVDADHHTRRTPALVRSHFVGRNMHGKTLGLVGFGQVGKRLAALCAQAFGMRVLVFSHHAQPEALAQSGAEKVALPELMQRSNYVVVCCALTPQTRGLIGAQEFARMQAHAYFVTTARAGIHDEAALIDALTNRRIAGAGIDVWDVEPPPLDHPLLQLDNVIATPHIAGATIESRTHASELAAQQIIQALAGQRPPQLLNPDVWPVFLQRLAQAFPERATASIAIDQETK